MLPASFAINFLLSYLVILLISGGITGFIADKKGYSLYGYFFVGLVLGVLGIVLIYVLPSTPEKIEEKKLQSRAGRKCPMCAEVVKAEAQICRYCRHELSPDPNLSHFVTIKKA